MGCCLSRSEDPNSPYPRGGGNAAASGSARAINQPATTSGSQTGNEDSAANASGSRRRRRHSHRPLAQHINKPLRLTEWSSQGRIWTPASLRREREEFFDTRVTGRQEVWQTIRAALEVLWASQAAIRNAGGGGPPRRGSEDDGPSEQDPSIALATAQSILSAAEITLPTGDLSNGVYDSMGNYYQIPHQIVSDPTNMSWVDDDVGDTKADLTGDEETAEEEIEEGDGDDEEGEDAERRREEKGKGVVNVKDLITIRARLSDGSKDVNVSVGKTDSVRSIGRQIADEAQLGSAKRVKIAYMGKILKDNHSLDAQGYKQGHVVNALVFNR
ncbi:hypothetical protein QBC38DRAFT_101919 [Podospora fimiseda]|uniref:Ubiquitin-like domain-containing protein n=1 Tax=Podospora fimiseda TaxID=252190 RepID=A0AAN6YSJ5_9PEZI|nr:hypothetical protein QBC38DRAFT_101919 [Podospora fimiseda]